MIRTLKQVCNKCQSDRGVLVYFINQYDISDTGCYVFTCFNLKCGRILYGTAKYNEETQKIEWGEGKEKQRDLSSYLGSDTYTVKKTGYRGQVRSLGCINHKFSIIRQRVGKKSDQVLVRCLYCKREFRVDFERYFSPDFRYQIMESRGSKEDYKRVTDFEDDLFGEEESEEEDEIGIDDEEREEDTDRRLKDLLDDIF